MLHPNTELKFVSPEIGYGVFARTLIPKGTITWVKDDLDRVIPKESLDLMSEANLENLLKYSYRNPLGDYVFCWDLTRYVNHSYKPNSMLTALGFEIAIRDIFPGEEMTNDYGTLNIIESFKCANGPSLERERVCPDDLSRFHALWDEQIQSAFTFINDLAQPLQVFLSPKQLQEILLIRSGNKTIPSVLTNLYKP
jgi:uncharacterized protein